MASEIEADPDYDRAVDWMLNQMLAYDKKLWDKFWRICEGEDPDV